MDDRRRRTVADREAARERMRLSDAFRSGYNEAWAANAGPIDTQGALVDATFRATDAGIAALLEHLSAAGRLLPEGGETRQEWAVRWYLPDGRHDDQDCRDIPGRETAEQRARRLAANPPTGAVRGEVWQRTIHAGPWRPVDTEEQAGG